MTMENGAEDMAQAALDGLAAQIAILDGDGRVVAVNAAWLARDNAAGSIEISEGADYLGVCDAGAGEGARGAGEAAGIRTVLAGEAETFSLEYPRPSPDGEHWFDLRVTRLPGDGPVRVVVSHEDVTRRRLSEETLRGQVEELAEAARVLERKNAELDQFAYITSHDLKAPLRGITNLSGWIEEDLEGSITPAVAGQLALLRGRVTRMEAMIEGILQFSRIGRTEVVSEAVDVKALLTDVIDLLDPPLHVAVTMDPALPTLWGPRVRLQQVFQNLIGNALKYHDKPQGHVHVGAALRGGFWEFAVSDDGPGIAPRFHDKVWVIFQTLQARDRVESTGLGLALVRKIVEGQGGTVALESNEGAGATFRFTWPASLRGTG